MRRFLLTAATAATALVGTACGDSIGLGSNAAGSYELRTINGVSVPVELGSEIIEGGVLELDSNGEFADIIEVRAFGSSSIEQRSFFGTWDQNGSEIRLRYDGGTTLFAERTSSSRIVLTDRQGDEWAYQRF